jgi:DNA-binding winged helix-turn-helix (wHTH) protein/tetratricopeptide (TPR) repeat protein/TolB-like protein
MQGLQSLPRTFAFADFILNPQDGTLAHRGHRVRLQDQPLRLLVLLVQQAGEVVTRKEIQAHLWPENTYVEFDKSLRVAVNKVREALRDSADRPIYIETVPRRGYRFIAPVAVKQLELPASTVAVDSLVVGQVAAPASDGLRPDPGRTSRWVLIAVPVALLVAIAMTLVFRRDHQQQTTREVSAHPLPRRSVAVLGLRNLNGDSSDRWLSTALAEMLSAELSASESLRVIPGEEVARAGLAEAPADTPSHETLTRYAHQLGADMVVYGSFAVTHQPNRGKAGDPVRLDLRLENFSSDAPSLVLIKTGKSASLFDVVAASGSDLRQRLGLEALTSEASSAVRKSMPTDATAAQFYAEGLNRLHLFDALGSRDLLQKAAKIEPGHAGTHLALSDAWNALGYEPEALAEAQRAVKLAEGLPRQQSLAMRGQLAIRSNDGAQATEIFRSLFTFYPDNVEYGLRLATAQDLAGNTRDALATLKTLNWSGIPEVDQARIELLCSRLDLDLGDFQGAISGSIRADQIGKDLNLNLIRAQGLWQQASALERMSKAQESLAASAEAEGFYKAAGDRRGEAVALLMKGDVQYDSGKLPDARATFELALALFQEVGHKFDTAVTLERIGNVLFDQGDLAESRRYYAKDLEINRELHIDGNVASAVGNIANVQDAEGDIEGAIKSNQEGLTLFERAGDQRGTAVTLTNMGNLEMERGAYEAAQQDYKRSEEINRKTGYNRGLAHALVGQGDVLVEQNDLAGGIRLYRGAFKLIESADEPEVTSNVLSSIGFAEMLQGQSQSAINDLQQAADLSRKRGNHSSASLILTWLARAQASHGDTEQAFATANRAIAEAQLQLTPRNRLIANLTLARLQTKAGTNAAAATSLQTTQQIAKRYGYGPLALEAQILLARTQLSSASQQQRLNALAQEATTRGWKLLAAEARAAQD